MASTINAQAGSTTTPTALIKSADATGILGLQTNSTTALTVNTSQNITANSTGSITVPSGTTAQRPASPVNGMLRYNTTIPQLEIYINGWISAL
jgi:hypothetical protein